MELSAATTEIYVRLAYRQMLEVADRLGDPLVNERPPGPDTNTVAQLVTHCCGVTEFWWGHVGLGRATTRDRDGEFTAVATVRELHALVEKTLARAGADLERICAGQTDGEHLELREVLEYQDTSDGSLVLHVIEELFQHLGQIELTADALAPAG